MFFCFKKQGMHCGYFNLLEELVPYIQSLGSIIRIYFSRNVSMGCLLRVPTLKICKLDDQIRKCEVQNFQCWLLFSE